jgi:DNA adenine methylase
MTRSPLIWFGGKGKVAHHIIQRMPAHKTYIEPFGGGQRM